MRRTSAANGTVNGCKQTGRYSCRKPADDSSRWQGWRPSSRIAPKRRGTKPWPLIQMIMEPSASTSFRREGHGFMRIDGEWRMCDDGETRPLVQAKVQGANGDFHFEFFLIDS